MLNSLLIALVLTQQPHATNPRDRAQAFYDEGLRQHRLERYDRSLQAFEMAAKMARFAFGQGELLGDSLRMAATAAIALGNAQKAVEDAKAYLEWSLEDGRPLDRARARNDVLEAYLMLGNADAARAAVAAAREAVGAGGDREQHDRLGRLERRLGGEEPDEPAPVLRRRTPQQDSVIKRRKVVAQAPDANPSPTPVAKVAASTPTPAPSPTGEDDGVKRTPIRRIGRPTPSATPTPPPAAPTPAPTATAARQRPARATAQATPAAAPPAEPPAIPTGELAMGDASGEDDEQPVRDIDVKAFRIDPHEVTNAEFARFAATAETGDAWRTHAGPGKERNPVRDVTWDEASAYCAWAGKRLPTEAEWERAARGPEGHAYSFGDGFATTAARVGLATEAGPAPVGSYPANGFGLHDMTGNVREWCHDWYDPLGYRRTYKWAPEGPRRGTERVVRGGSWTSDARDARVANRSSAPPDSHSPEIGFRCATDAD